MADIELGSLPRFEYGMLRAALTYAVRYCKAAVDGTKGSEDLVGQALARHWNEQLTEIRAIRARFRKTGRAGLKS